MLARLLAEAMAARGAGHLVFVSSLSGKAASPRRRSTRRRSSACAGSRSACAQDLARHGVGVSCVFPGFVRDAGMFADSGARLPPGVGTSTPEDVARGIVRAIERNRAEVDVGAARAAAGARLAGLAPGLAASVQQAARRLEGRALDRRRPARQALARPAADGRDAPARRRRRCSRRPPRAVAMTILAGAAISLQSYVNGRLGKDVGSRHGRRRGQQPRSRRRDAADRARDAARCRGRSRGCAGLGRPPLWHFLGGLGGAALVLVSAAAAPEVGVALLTVALVCGSTGGSLPVDAAGLGPAGRRPITAPRAVAACCWRSARP